LAWVAQHAQGLINPLLTQYTVFELLSVVFLDARSQLDQGPAKDSSMACDARERLSKKVLAIQFTTFSQCLSSSPICGYSPAYDPLFQTL